MTSCFRSGEESESESQKPTPNDNRDTRALHMLSRAPYPRQLFVHLVAQWKTYNLDPAFLQFWVALSVKRQGSGDARKGKASIAKANEGLSRSGSSDAHSASRSSATWQGTIMGSVDMKHGIEKCAGDTSLLFLRLLSSREAVVQTPRIFTRVRIGCQVGEYHNDQDHHNSMRSRT